MTPQRRILPLVAQQILQRYPCCSILLIGSVARGEERPEDSDLDLNVFFPTEPTPSVWVNEENRWQLQIKRTVGGVRVDVAWETMDNLEQELKTEGPYWQRSIWIMSSADIIHDPSGRIGSCLRIVREWTARNADLCAELEASFRAAKARQIAKRNCRH